MFPDVKQMLSFMKMKGFKKSKDVLGTYFDKSNHKFSLMRQGDWYICYHNIKQDKAWVLVARSQIHDSFQSALYWVVQQVQKNHQI